MENYIRDIIKTAITLKIPTKPNATPTFTAVPTRRPGGILQSNYQPHIADDVKLFVVNANYVDVTKTIRGYTHFFCYVFIRLISIVFRNGQTLLFFEK